MFLSVVIPAYNEEKRLPETLKKVKDYLEKQSYDWEVLIVNDGSKDRTAQVVEALVKEWNDARQHPSKTPALAPSSDEAVPTRSAKNPAEGGNHAFWPVRVALRMHGSLKGSSINGSFQLIDNKINRGKGAVVKQGMLAAKGDWRLYMDADNSTDISEIEKLFNFSNLKSQMSNSNQITNSKSKKFAFRHAKLEKCNLNGHCNLEFGAYEIIAGSRYLKKDSIKIKQPLLRRIVSRIGNILIRILLGIHSVDTQCGFKMFSAKATKEIFPLQTMERWGAEMEVWTIAINKGYKIKEVAVDWYDSKGSTVRKSAALQTLKELLIIKWNLIKGKYS